MKSTKKQAIHLPFMSGLQQNRQAILSGGPYRPYKLIPKGSLTIDKHNDAYKGTETKHEMLSSNSK